MLTKAQKRMVLVVIFLMTLPLLTGLTCNGPEIDKKVISAIQDTVEAGKQVVEDTGHQVDDFIRMANPLDENGGVYAEGFGRVFGTTD